MASVVLAQLTQHDNDACGEVGMDPPCGDRDGLHNDTSDHNRHSTEDSQSLLNGHKKFPP